MALNAKQEKRFQESDLFSGCDVKSIRILAQSLAPVSVLKGQQLSSAHSAPALGFLLDGSLDVCSLNGVLYFTLEAGAFFELESIFSEIHPLLPYQFRARSNCIVTFINKDLLLPIFHDNPQVAQNYMEILADKLQLTACRLHHFTAATPSVALGLYLLRNERHGSVRLADGFAGLARRLNISRATLYRSLAELEQLKLVEHQEKTVYIISHEQLQRYIWVNSASSGNIPLE
ncbi:MAG: Crp/Fnr family transcriptional regulator [Clostridia bacterium]|nr:Crp/Fnr family transcriptional regulator [Clostridia bacterium]